MMPPAKFVLGIDGGGTKTVAWLARWGGDNRDLASGDGKFGDAAPATETIGRGRAGSSNVRSVGFETALIHLNDAIEKAFHDAGLDRCTVDGACLALAGADREVEQKRLRAWADGCQLANRLTIVNDAWPVLYAAGEAGEGIAMISGTGSLAIGRNAKGDTARCGGWGGLIGDEGSGYQISLSAFRGAVRADDGRGPPTRLLPDLLEHYEIAHASELIPIVYAESSDRASIASIAPLVFSAARTGDIVAREIIDQASTDLAEMVATLARRLGFTAAPFRLAATGSVLLQQPSFAQDVRDKLSRSGLMPEYVAVDESVAGTLVIARRSLGQTPCRGDLRDEQSILSRESVPGE